MKGLLIAGITRQLGPDRHTVPALCIGHPFTDIRRLRSQDKFPPNVDVLVFVPHLGLLSETSSISINTINLKPVTIPDGYDRVCIYVTEAQWQAGLWAATSGLPLTVQLLHLKGSPGERMRNLMAWLDRTRELAEVVPVSA